MKSYLEKLNIYKLRFSVKCIEDIELPRFSGSTIRGAFGVMLKKNVCVQRKWRHSCENCMIKSSCVYSYIFETKNLDYNDKNIKLKSPPHPFVLSIDFNDKPVTYPKNAIIEWDFTFFGNHIMENLPYIIFTFEKMGETGIGKTRGRYKIVNIILETARDSKIIYDQKTRKLDRKITPYSLEMNNQDQKANFVTIDMVSPFKIKNKGKDNNNPEFSEIITNILRRYDVLLNYHQPDQYESIDYQQVINKSKTVKIKENDTVLKIYKRFSGRQKKWISHYGIIGNITYEGDIQDFIPLLEIGSLINIGKSTSFGFGKYKYKTLTQ